MSETREQAMNYPKELKYTKEDEWLKVEGDTGTVGITDYAQNALGDIVFVELPKPGATVEVGKSFGTVESVKAVSELYSPVSGTVTAVNGELTDAPEKINSDPYGAWMIKVKLTKQSDSLMSAADYEKYAAERG
ncbi:MAG TPA: glycine cleavage system protein GcvH [Terriglobales bacterium]|nr:glycine cleavage system protein GcvH [Terriglobales bacterium]